MNQRAQQKLSFGTRLFRLFYNSRIVETVERIMEMMCDAKSFHSSASERKRSGKIQLYANTLHHAYAKSHIWRQFWCRNFLRFVITLWLLIVVHQSIFEAGISIWSRG